MEGSAPEYQARLKYQMETSNYYGVCWQEGGMDFDIWCGHKHTTLAEAADCIEIELIENYDAWISVMAHISGHRRKLNEEERAELQNLLPRRKVA